MTAPRPILALTVTLLVQTLAAVALTSPSVLAPVVATELAVGAQHVGWLVSLAYLTAMLTGLGAGSLSQRFGPVRTSQAALLAAAAGLALFAAGRPATLLAGAVVLGVAYGLPNPTAAEILSRHAPAQRRGLFFSIKQTGVPIGVAGAGVALPALLGRLPWSGALIVLAAVTVAAAAAIGAGRRSLEAGTPQGRADDPSAREAPAGAAPAGTAPAGAGAAGASARAGTTRPDTRHGTFVGQLLDALRSRVLAPLVEVLAFAPTRRLAIASLVFALTQVSFLTFLVTLLTLEHGLSLTVAASLLAASQALSVAGRIGWGHAADRWLDPTRLLGGLGVAMGAAIIALGLAPGDAPAGLMLAITLACALTAVAWNGVFFADLVRLVPPERVARATGATQFLTFTGGMSGSALFAAGVSLGGSYSTVFAALGALPALTGLMLLVAARSPAGGNRVSGSTGAARPPPR